MRNDIICIIQARMDSSRLPAKVVAPIAGNPLLYYVIKRVSLSRLEKIVVATTEMPVDNIVGFVSQACKVDCFHGDESDVLSRFVQATKLYNASAVIRITADCPLIDPGVINKIMDIYEEYPGSDYIFIEGYPRGLGDVEFISNSALKKCFRDTGKDQTYYREHVMTYITENPDKFNIRIEKSPMKERRDYRLCVDELDDLKVVRDIYNHFLPRMDFNSEDIISFLDENPEIAEINRHVKQKTG
ncbi:MAG: glycosyltransferase family protein [Candidatus Methanoperedens sp.]|nr:glycosyltransferase family protein [Candidatus Methanoperedens sp.]